MSFLSLACSSFFYINTEITANINRLESVGQALPVAARRLPGYKFWPGHFNYVDLV